MTELIADILHKVSTTNPIFVVNQSGHIAYVNHKALELAGITDTTPDPGNGGVYVRDAHGKLTGKLVEPPAYKAFAAKRTSSLYLYRRLALVAEATPSSARTTATPRC